MTAYADANPGTCGTVCLMQRLAWTHGVVMEENKVAVQPQQESKVILDKTGPWVPWDNSNTLSLSIRPHNLVVGIVTFYAFVVGGSECVLIGKEDRQVRRFLTRTAPSLPDKVAIGPGLCAHVCTSLWRDV